MHKVIWTLLATAVSGCAHVPQPTAPTVAADESPRTVIEAVSPTRRAVVVEGEFEPRSMGSYAVRLYDPVDPQLPYERYLAGRVMPRQGVLESALWEDVDRDGTAELVVVVRSVGTGSYLHADAFTEDNGSLKVLVSAHGLPKDADVLAALREKSQ